MRTAATDDRVSDLSSHRRKKRLRRFLADRGGVSAVEFAIVAPFLIGMLIPVTDLGLAFAKKTQLHNAVRAGTQYALVNGWDVNGITSAVNAATKVSPLSITPAPGQTCGCPTGAGINSVTCGSTCPDRSDAGTYVTVSAQTTYNTVFNYPVMGSTVVLYSSTIARIK